MRTAELKPLVQRKEVDCSGSGFPQDRVGHAGEKPPLNYLSLNQHFRELINFKKTTIHEGHVGLQFKDGKYVATLEAGTYRTWSSAEKILVANVRQTWETVNGQEVSTNDGGFLKVSVTVYFHISDAITLYRASDTDPKNFSSSLLMRAKEYIHIQVQTAIRTWANARSFKDAYQQRADLAPFLLEQVRTNVSGQGITIDDLQPLDIVPSGTLKTAMTDLLRADLDGQIALAKARNESATMRSLINTARLVREHPNLLELRILSTGQKPKVTFFVGSEAAKSAQSLNGDES